MSVTVEQLELEIQSKSTSAASGIDALTTSLSKLKNALRGGSGLNTVAKQVNDLDNAVNNMDVSQTGKVDKMVASLEKLKSLNGIKLSSSLSNQLKSLGEAAYSLVGVSFAPLRELEASLSPLASMDKAAGLASVNRELKKLPESVAALQGVNLDSFGEQVDKLTRDLTPLNNISKMSGLQSIVKSLQNIPIAAAGLNHVDWDGFNDDLVKLTNTLKNFSRGLNEAGVNVGRFPKSINQLIKGVDKTKKKGTEAKTSFINIKSAMDMIKSFSGVAINHISSWIEKSNQYIEDVNLFTISMGEYAGQAKEYAEQVGEVMGIDPGEFMRNQGIFNTIITGFGVASDKAYVMSQNLTQLGYDLSSFANISFEESMQKLSSGISGELEPLRRLGYDLSVARLQEEALALGITKRVSAMTQAEKSQLRYHAIMTQVTIAQGDMGRTLNAPANQLRILKAQVLQASRALGNAFIPILNAVLPYAIALAKVVRLLAQSVASLFGFKMPEVDFGGISAGASAAGALADNADDAAGGLGKAGKAAKKLKNALLGIDELNVLSRDDDSAGGGGGAGGGGFDIPLPTYDFLSNAVNSRVENIVEMIKKAMWEITAVVSTFALAIGTILVVTGANIPLGVALMTLGAVGLVSTIALNWNSMSDSLARTLEFFTAVLGGFLLAVGAILVFTGGNIPLGVGLMVAGAVSLGTSVAINWKSLEGDLTTALAAVEAAISTALLVIGTYLAFTGANVPLGIGLMAAGAVGLATAATLNWDKLSDKVKDVITGIGTAAGIGLCVGAILAFSGANIPLGIALLVAGVTTLGTVAKLNWNTLTGKTEGQIKKLELIAFGATLGIGAALAFSCVNIPLGLGLIAIGATGLASKIAPDWNGIVTKVKSVLKDIGIAVGGAVLSLGIILALFPPTLPVGLALLALGAAGIVSGVALNWDSLGGKIKGVLDKIKKFASKAFIPLGLMLCLTPVGLPLGLALIAAGAANLVSSAPIDWDAVHTKIKAGLDKAKKAFEDFSAEAGKILNDIATKVSNWADSVGKFFAKTKDGKDVEQILRESGKSLGDYMKKGVSDSFVDSKSWVKKDVLNPIENAVNSSKPVSVAIGVTNNAPQMWESTKIWWANETKGGLKAETSVKLVKDGWSTVDAWIGKIPSRKQAVGLVKEGWDTVSNWIGKIPTLDQTIELAKSGWASVKEWVGDIPTLSQRINLTKQGWDTVNNWVGHIPTLSQAINLVKSGWETVQGWIGHLPTIEQAVSLIKSGWSSVRDWIGTSAIDIKVNLTKGAWDTVTSGLSSLGENLGRKLGVTESKPIKAGKTRKLKNAGAHATGGIITAHAWKHMPKYAGGTNRAHGSMFVAGESGAELVGHVNGRTEVINRFQLAGIMHDSIVSGMAQFGGYWKAMSRDMIVGTDAIVNAINMSASSVNENMVLATATSLDPYNSLANTVYASSEVSRDNSGSDDMWYRNIRAFYHEYLEPTLKDIANDTKRQADKHEQTIVKIGNRTVTDAVTTQRDANGYRFID